jgi:hypothetical protein
VDFVVCTLAGKGEKKKTHTHRAGFDMSDRDLLEKPPEVQLLKNFSTFYGTPKVNYRAHKSPPLVPYPKPYQSQSYPVYLRSILM